MASALIALTAGARVAHAEEPPPLQADAALTSDLEKRNAERDAADQAKASEELRRMSDQAEASRTKENELRIEDGKLRTALAAEDDRIMRHNVGTLLLVFGGATVAAGAACYASALSDEASIKNGEVATNTEILSRASSMETMSQIGVTTLVLGGVAAAIGGALFFTSTKPSGGYLDTRKRGGLDLNLDLRRGTITW